MVFIETGVTRARILIKNGLFGRFSLQFLPDHKHKCKPAVPNQSGRILRGVDIKGNACQRDKVVRKMLLATFNTGSHLLAFPSYRPTGNSGQALLSPCTQMAVLCFYFENVVYVSGSLWGNRSSKW